MAEFLSAIPLTLSEEGGYTANKNDKGNKGGLYTYRGLTKKDNPQFTGWPIIESHFPLRWNQIINDANLESLIKQYYKLHYWDKVKGDQIDSQRVAAIIFDWYVNSGEKAIMRTQEVLGIQQTGFFGNITLGGLQTEISINEESIFERIKARRIKFYEDHCQAVPSDKCFLADWLRRINKFI